jgi:hypothetical protein
MSSTGHFILFHREELPNPRELLPKLMADFGVEKFSGGRRTLGPDNGWELVLSGSDEDVPLKYIRPLPAVHEISTYFIDDCSLALDISQSKLNLRFYELMQDQMQSWIMENFMFTNLSMTIGWHDIFENNGPKERKFYGRAFFSLSFWGYNPPDDPIILERALYAHPGILKVKAEVEALVGKLDMCMTYSY